MTFPAIWLIAYGYCAGKSIEWLIEWTIWAFRELIDG